MSCDIRKQESDQQMLKTFKGHKNQLKEVSTG